MCSELKNVSPKRHIQVLSPSMSVTLFGKWVFVDIIKLKMNSYRGELAPTALTSVLRRRGTFEDRRTPGEECHAKTQAEVTRGQPGAEE